MWDEKKKCKKQKELNLPDVKSNLWHQALIGKVFIFQNLNKETAKAYEWNFLQAHPIEHWVYVNQTQRIY